MLRLCTAALLALLLAVAPAAASAPKPFNHIAVVIDGSGSFHGHAAEAVDDVKGLLAGLEQQQALARHWEASDRITVIALDAVPSAIFQGSVADLAKTKDADWANRFAARTDLEGCTDLKRALELATATLAEAPAPSKKILFIYSDLIVEPPTTSPNTCAPRESVLGDDFKWDSLSDVRMAVFWLPPAQVLAWDRALRIHGLTSYKLYSAGESQAATVDIPERAKREVTDKDKQAARRYVGAIGFWLNITAAAVALMFIVIMLILVFRRPRRRSPALPSGTRMVRGDVAPMRLPNGPPETRS